MQNRSEAPGVPINLGVRTPLGERNERRSLLLICGAILFLSSALGINQSGRVYLPPFEQFGLPAMCATKVLFHLDCAGCGITRSLVSIGHGNWRAGLAFHPAGLAVYGFLWAQVLFQVIALQRLRRGQSSAQNRFLSWYFYLLLAMFFATGISRFWPR
ncbi:MAG TPA: DUF2752 domain-containing protein [Abditibacteriaceae bacterium]|jgi:hypothetical protein